MYLFKVPLLIMRITRDNMCIQRRLHITPTYSLLYDLAMNDRNLLLRSRLMRPCYPMMMRIRRFKAMFSYLKTRLRRLLRIITLNYMKRRLRPNERVVKLNLGRTIRCKLRPLLKLSCARRVLRARVSCLHQTLELLRSSLRRLRRVDHIHLIRS